LGEVHLTGSDLVSQQVSPGPRVRLDLRERRADRGRAGIVLRLQESLVHDLWQVRGVEEDGVEPVFPPLERLAERDLLGADRAAAKEVFQVALAGDEG